MPLIGRQTDERETDRQTDKHAGIQKRRQRKSTRLKSGGNLTPIHRSYRPWTVTTIISPPILPPIPPLIDAPLLPSVPSILLFIHPSFCSSFLSSVYLLFLLLISPSLDQSILPSIRTSFHLSIHPPFQSCLRYINTSFSLPSIQGAAFAFICALLRFCPDSPVWMFQ